MIFVFHLNIFMKNHSVIPIHIPFTYVNYKGSAGQTTQSGSFIVMQKLDDLLI